MRSTIVYMLRSLGVQHIKALSINSGVFVEIARPEYDIVLLGHNVREPVSGLQILEEIQHRNMMRPETVWMLMTSDSSQEVILHALDNQPDGVITKPFSAEELKRRLNHLLRKKQFYRPLDEAISEDNWEQALLICERDLKDDRSDYVAVVQSKMLLNLNQFREAGDVLERAYKFNPDKSIALAMAKVAIEQQQYDYAREMLLALIERYPLTIPAYDMLADVYSNVGDLAGAIEILRDATTKAPLGVPRHMRLGEVAVKHKSYDTASYAFKKSIVLGKNSCHRSYKAYLKLANVKRLQLPSVAESEAIVLRESAQALINASLRKFPQSTQLRVEAALFRAELEEGRSEYAKAQQLRIAAERYNGQLEQPYDMQRLKLELLGDNVPILESEAEDSLQEDKRDSGRSVKINRQGVKLYLAGKLVQASKHFTVAVELDDKNCMACLNQAQVLIEMARDNENHREQRCKAAQRYIKRTDEMELNQTEAIKSAQLRTLLQRGVENLPEGSLGGLLH